MTPDELAVMDGGKCILQVQGVRPFFSDKFDITKHPQYKYLSDSDPKNTFDVAKFVKHRLKVKPEDTYEVCEVEVPADPGSPATWIVCSGMFYGAWKAGKWKEVMR